MDTRSEISRLEALGHGPRQIARILNARGVETPTGRGVWWHSTVIRHRSPQAWALYMKRYRARARGDE